MTVVKIISGGQTGVDRAALDAAISAGIPCGGFCPAGRRADDGPIPQQYPLTETNSRSYPLRTKLNVETADGTLIIISGHADRGTMLTAQLCRQKLKPLLYIHPEDSFSIHQAAAWINHHNIQVLNVAGPRESSSPGIYKMALKCLDLILSCEKTGMSAPI